MSIHTVFLVALASLLPAGQGSGHYIPMVSHGYPTPPPTVDPGPDASMLRVTIVDAASGSQTSATVSVNGGDHEPDRNPYAAFGLRRMGNRHKGPIRFRKIPYYFYTDGRFEIRVPPGKTKIHVGKGYEFQPTTSEVAVGKSDTLDVAIRIERAIDMAARGWYSGDTHIHIERSDANDDTILVVTSAKDIRYAYLLSMNTGGYDLGGEIYESYHQRAGLGDRSVAAKGPYHIASGQEYRTRNLGHVTLEIPDEYIPADGVIENASAGPSLGVIADQTHERSGFIGLAHGGYHNQEADGLLLDSKMDFLELLQFGGYRSLGLRGWYDFLNIGFQLPIVGASDFPPTRELGSEITYVWSDTIPTPRTFLEAVSEGKSFATSGPMLFATVSGRKPGEMIVLPEGADSTLTVNIDIISPIHPVRYVELIVNGRIRDRHFASEGRTRWMLQANTDIDETSWIAVRTYGDAGTEAHTNPVYVYVGGRRRFDRASARNIIARLNGSIEAIDVEDVVANLTRLKHILQQMLAGQSGLLPLPSIPE